MIRTTRVVAVAALVASAAAAQAPASKPFELDSLTIAGFRWRNVGPANTMGRMSDVTGIPSPSKTFFAAAAAGGIWKSTNNGVTWRPVFDNQRVISMGMLAIAPSDTMQVWAGTGEPNSRNTISPGGGVYKSTDGGITWKLMGLEKTQLIGRIVVHPTNPNIVYVAALGAPWSANPERGLYKTDRRRQDVAARQVHLRQGRIRRRRDRPVEPEHPSGRRAGSACADRTSSTPAVRDRRSGRSTDAGKTWTEIKGGGFPETTKGRIGISISISNPQVMYTHGRGRHHRESESPRRASPRRSRRRDSIAPATAARRGRARTIRTRDPSTTRRFACDPKNPDRVYWSSTPVLVSNDGGKTVVNATNGIHVDHHAMWIDPNDPDRIIVGDDGGVAITFDQGGNVHVREHDRRSRSCTTSATTSRCRTACAAACRTTVRGAGRAGVRQGPITNAMWFTSAAATDS